MTRVGGFWSRMVAGLALSALVLVIAGHSSPASRVVAAGPCALQDGFDLWQGRWRLILSAPGVTPQVVTLEMVELAGVVSGSFPTVDGPLQLTGTARQRSLGGSFRVGATTGSFKFRLTGSFRAFSGTWFKPTTRASGTYLGGGPSRACVLLGFEGEKAVDASGTIVFSAFVQAEGPAAIPPETRLILRFPDGLPRPAIFDQFNSRCRQTLGGDRVICRLEALGPGQRRASVGLEFKTAPGDAGRTLVFVADVVASDAYRLPNPAGQLTRQFRVRVRAG